MVIPLQHTRNIKVFVVDDQPVVRWGIRDFFEADESIHVCGETGSIEDALNQIEAPAVDVVTLETALPMDRGIAITEVLVREKSVQVVAFSSREDWNHVTAFIKAGGKGFVPKRCPLDDLATAIKSAASGREWISPIVCRSHQATQQFKDGEAALSKTELEVADLVVRGLTSNQIADQLRVSREMVETHRHRIFKKLGVQSHADLIDRATEQDLSRGVERSRGEWSM